MNGSMVYYKCKKVGHLKRDCRVPMPRNDNNQSEDIYENMRNQMEKTWKKKEEGTTMKKAHLRSPNLIDQVIIVLLTKHERYV